MVGLIVVYLTTVFTSASATVDLLWQLCAETNIVSIIAFAVASFQAKGHLFFNFTTCTSFAKTTAAHVILSVVSVCGRLCHFI